MSKKINIYNRKITISKHQSNTHYSVSVFDSYGTEHHIGYYSHYSEMHDIEDLAKGIWDNEVKPEEDLMSKAVLEFINLDRIRGVEPDLD